MFDRIWLIQRCLQDHPWSAPVSHALEMALENEVAFQKHFLRGAPSSRHRAASSSPVSAALTEGVLPVIILPLYVNRRNNYLNTQLQISWRVSVVGKIKPRRFAIREFGVQYLLTSIMILAKLLTFYYWDDSVRPGFFPTKILGARWIFWNSEFFRIFIKVICCIHYVGRHRPSMTRALLQEQSYYYLCSKICQYLRKWYKDDA